MWGEWQGLIEIILRICFSFPLRGPNLTIRLADKPESYLSGAARTTFAPWRNRWFLYGNVPGGLPAARQLYYTLFLEKVKRITFFSCVSQAPHVETRKPLSALPRKKIKGDSAQHRARKRIRRRTRTKAYRESQKLRKFIEPVIGWCKLVGGLGRTRFIGHERIQNDAMLVASA